MYSHAQRTDAEEQAKRRGGIHKQNNNQRKKRHFIGRFRSKGEGHPLVQGSLVTLVQENGYHNHIKSLSLSFYTRTVMLIRGLDLRWTQSCYCTHAKDNRTDNMSLFPNSAARNVNRIALPQRGTRRSVGGQNWCRRKKQAAGTHRQGCSLMIHHAYSMDREGAAARAQFEF